MTKKDYIRAADICFALVPEVRTVAIDAFTDFFRGDNPRFDVARFESAARGYAPVTKRTLQSRESKL